MPSDLTAAQARLTTARAAQRRAALGAPLALTDAMLDTLSTVGPADMPETVAFVRAVAGERGVALLEAR